MQKAQGEAGEGGEKKDEDDDDIPDLVEGQSFEQKTGEVE